MASTGHAKTVLASTPGPLREWLGRAVPLLLLTALIGLVVLLAAEAPVITQRRVILGLVSLVAVVGLYVFMGNSGILNFSSLGFMAIGAYTSVLLTLPQPMKGTFLPDLPGWLAEAALPALSGPFLGGLAAAAVALVVGLPIMRLSGIAAAIATFSLLFIASIVLGNWNAVTGGQISIMGLKAYVTLPVAGAFAVGAVAVAFLFQETRWALALRASREDEVAARACGIRIVPLRLGAFVLGAFLSGGAGALYAHVQGTLRVENYSLDLTFLYVTMLVVGGMRSLTGAVLGTLVISALSEGLRLLEAAVSPPGSLEGGWSVAGLGDVVLAGLMLLILILRPHGLTGGREIGDLLGAWRRGGGGAGGGRT
jgi:branched-chain amino acid transport system permease protein